MLQLLNVECEGLENYEGLMALTNLASMNDSVRSVRATHAHGDLRPKVMLNFITGSQVVDCLEMCQRSHKSSTCESRNPRVRGGGDSIGFHTGRAASEVLTLASKFRHQGVKFNMIPHGEHQEKSSVHFGFSHRQGGVKILTRGRQINMTPNGEHQNNSPVRSWPTSKF